MVISCSFKASLSLLVWDIQSDLLSEGTYCKQSLLNLKI